MTITSTQRWHLLRQWVLLKINRKPVEKFSIKGVHVVKVARVYDGDTFFGHLLLDRTIHEFSFRMLGYNSAEMRPPKKLAFREDVIKRAHASKEKLLEYIPLNSYVVVECTGFGKYGRVLANVYLSPEDLEQRDSVNKKMIFFENWLEAEAAARAAEAAAGAAKAAAAAKVASENDTYCDTKI